MRWSSLAFAACRASGCGGLVVSPVEAKRKGPGRRTLEMWNAIGDRLVAVAQDFPEEQYDFKLQKDERTFAENLLHVEAVDCDLLSSLAGSQLGPGFGENAHSPSREVHRTTADVVKLNAAGRRGWCEID